MKYKLELTDTFGGEANYSWVKRQTIEADESNIIRRAKREMGLSGVRCRKEDLGEYTALYPYNSCIILFIELADNY